MFKDFAPYRIFQIVIFITLVGYVTFRAYNLSFTHDEATTYTIAKGDRTYTVSANHHILNSHLMGIASKLFGDSELSMRLPNVLSFVLYILMCFKMVEMAKSVWKKILALCLLLLNPFLLEYFSLARGYGISLGFLMVSLWFFVRRDQRDSDFNTLNINYLWSIGFAALALWANASTINVYIALMAIFVGQFGLRSIQKGLTLKSFSMFFGVFILSCYPLFMAVRRLLFLDKRDQLYFGANRFDDMLSNITFNSMLLTESNVISDILKWLMITVFIAGIIFLFWKRKSDGPFLKISLVMVLILLGLQVEHVFFEAKFPLERTAIYFIPMLGLFVFYLLEEVEKYFKIFRKSRIHKDLAITILVPMLYNLISKANTEETYNWKFDKHQKDVAQILEALPPKVYAYTISNPWLFEPSINYYIQTRKLNFQPTNREGVRFTTDFIYVFSTEPKPDGYEVLKDFKDNGTVLYKKLNP